MPVYEYKCNCGKVFSMMRSMGAGTEGVTCPECNGTDITKLLSATFSPDSSKAMPSSFDMPKMGGGGGGCSSGMCGSGMCGM
jgi:putative FmdB family regulatory protein